MKANKGLVALELFSGTKSVGKVLESHGVEVISVDIFDEFNPTIVADILKLDYRKLPTPDFIWASPPCNSYSKLAVANKSRDYWTLKPLKPNAKMGDKILYKTLEIIEYFIKKNPKLLFVIENPHGMMWRMPIINTFPKELTQYCLYGFEYRKPTDFFHNFKGGLNLKDLEKYQCKKELVNVASVPLEQRYRIPTGIIEQIYQEFIRQYRKEKPEKISFEKTKKITLKKKE